MMSLWQVFQKFTVFGKYKDSIAGTHRLEWRYSKDFSVSEGEDSGWLDNVNWQPDVPKITISVTKDGNGKGTVSESTFSFNCGINCEQASFVVDAGTLLQFKASAAVGSDFVGWVGACNDAPKLEP
ncbi:hypothetical protein [Alishewanella longhuensis]